MDACCRRLALALTALSCVAAAPKTQITQYATRNFLVTAPTAEMARQVGEAAEYYRKELAKAWLGYELPAWSARCPIKVKVGQIGAGGATTFTFHPSPSGPAEVTGWNMQIQGSLERILDSVLPHEVSHTIFACHFRRPLPRWADEGAATLAEHESEKRRQVLTLRQVMGTRRRMPLRQLMNIKEYPSAMQEVMTLYAEGYSLAEMLVQEGGKARYLKFLADAHAAGWEQAVRESYGYPSIEALEARWHKWIMAGSPEINAENGVLVAAYAPAHQETRPAARASDPVVRGQSPARGSETAAALAMGHFEPRSPLQAPRPVVSASSRQSGDDRAAAGAAPDEPAADLASAEAPATARQPARRARPEPGQRVPWSEFPSDPRPSVLVFRERVAAQ